MKRNYIKQLLMLMLFMPFISIQAQDVEYMNVYLASQGSAQSINIDEIDLITFSSDDEVVIKISGVETPMAIDNIELITFGNADITAIEESDADIKDIEMVYISTVGEVRITSPEVITKVQIYNIQGVLMQNQLPGVETATLNVSSYPNGIYIVAVQSNGKIEAKKFIK